MTWLRVDDKFVTSGKVLHIPRAQRLRAVGLWLMAAAWCAGQETDGRVPAFMVDELGGDADAVNALLDAGLWESEPDVFVFHDWADWQPSHATLEAKRLAARERMARSRELRAKSHESSREVRSTPTRPDPTNTSTQVSEASSVGEGVRGSAPRKRGCHIPDPFVVTADMRRWAASEVGGVDVDASTRAFVDHWRAESGQRAVKRDWTAAWRNWLRRDADHARPRAPTQTPTQRALATAQAGARVQAELDASTRKAIA